MAVISAANTFGMEFRESSESLFRKRPVEAVSTGT